MGHKAPLYRQKFYKHLAWPLIALVSLYVLLPLVGARAAKTPSLGAAASCGVLANTYTNTSASTAGGEANGLTARDLAIATVTVGSVPGLPNIGIKSGDCSFVCL